MGLIRDAISPFFMKYLSVCSGIEAATVAWEPLGWNPVGFSEIEKFPSEVLAHHYPDVPNFGDMTKYKEWELESIDVLVGGTPCQSFSVAGLRKGLEDPRGNLMLTYCGILDRFRPNWFVWENVPGVLSSNGGRDFGSFLGAVAELGYGFAYRVLDAQYFGVAQRRRRVFVVGHFGDWRPAAKVLFEPQSLCRDSPPSREKRKIASPIPAQCFDRQSSGEYGTRPIASTMSARDYKNASDLVLQPPVLMDQGGTIMNFSTDGIVGTLRRETHGHNPIVVHGTQDPCVSTDTSFALGRNNGGENVLMQPIPLDLRNANRDPEKHDEINRQGVGVGQEGDPSHTLTTACVHGVYAPAEVGPAMGASGPPYSRTGNERVETEALAIHNMAVRRLTPVECERLQGFPDNYTDIKPKGKETPDGPRYKALGNSMAVPVMAWIGKRINEL